MPTNNNEIKTEELTSREIRAGLELKGIPPAEIARRVQRRTGKPCPAANVSRVIHRTPGFSFSEIRREIAGVLGVPVAAVGREASRRAGKKVTRRGRTVAATSGA